MLFFKVSTYALHYFLLKNFVVVIHWEIAGEAKTADMECFMSAQHHKRGEESTGEDFSSQNWQSLKMRWTSFTTIRFVRKFQESHCAETYLRNNTVNLVMHTHIHIICKNKGSVYWTPKTNKKNKKNKKNKEYKNTGILQLYLRHKLMSLEITFQQTINNKKPQEKKKFRKARTTYRHRF